MTSELSLWPEAHLSAISVFMITEDAVPKVNIYFKIYKILHTVLFILHYCYSNLIFSISDYKTNLVKERRGAYDVSQDREITRFLEEHYRQNGTLNLLKHPMMGQQVTCKYFVNIIIPYSRTDKRK